MTRTVLEQPTYTSEGRQQISQRCRHCAWADEDVVTVPRLQRSTSGGTSSGRSFSGSGGRSSGGGWSGGGGGGRSRGRSSSGRGASGRW